MSDHAIESLAKALKMIAFAIVAAAGSKYTEDTFRELRAEELHR